MRRRLVGLVAVLAATTLARAADRGERAYYHGDYALSAVLFAEEARAGHAVAQTFLGYQYEYGLGVPKSYAQAARWYICAAEQGEPTAQFHLGQLYDRGEGVPEEPIEAAKWLDLAAAHAPRNLQEHWAIMRDNISAKMSLDELAEAQGLAAEWSPSYRCPQPSEVEVLRLPTHKYSRRESYSER